ncbi:RagB/SusD family nutrient uptake outer membrane protein [uncultured Sunxiuqinia sp.]|uniref:RagB/SusD family nutrient uptake outer membrane protein n=1 Tax=uncultured Sunxiuqinia sp. TaxID=1573825 RepID=UPI002AA72F38|nr:RagB/SusD family nutrient uptake outer membrane protein [uncultured Sunxiuqinia sp.]
MKKILIITLLFTCFSCDRYLDIKPYGKTIPKTAEEFSALLQTHLNDINIGGTHSLLFDGESTLNFAMYADNFEACLTERSGSTLPIYVGSYINYNQFVFYRNFYAIIRDCNIVLDGVSDPNSDELSKKVVATAYAMRGVAYYNLLQMFCKAPEAGNFQQQEGLPLVKTFDMEEKPIRSSMEETIELIEHDLQKAISYQQKDALYLFTEEVTKGYLARLYFWLEQWSKALDLAQQILAAQPLLSGVAYTDMMRSAHDVTGNILIRTYTTSDATSVYNLTIQKTTLSYRPVSKRFIDLFDLDGADNDIRYSLFLNRLRQNQKELACGMRAAEFKLIEAECYYHLNKTTEALQSINEFRSHRISNYTPLTEGQLPEVNSSAKIKVDAEGKVLTPLLSLILSERRKELFLENGDRWFELKRNGAPEFWTAYNSRKYVTESFMYTFPLLLDDVTLTPGLVQNPGYEDYIR